jgi:hypothetical protein
MSRTATDVRRAPAGVRRTGRRERPIRMSAPWGGKAVDGPTSAHVFKSAQKAQN